MLEKINFFFLFLFQIYFLFTFSEDDVIFRLNASSLVEIEDENGDYLPLCADTFTPTLAEIICQREQLSIVQDFQQIPLINITSLNVECSSSKNCSKYLAFGCGSGVQLNCIKKNTVCPPGFYFFTSNKCIKISKKLFTSYEKSEKFCSNQNLSLVSFYALDIKTQINAVINVLKRINFTPNADTKLLTSGIRQSNLWQWKNGVILNDTVDSSKGRCLGIFVDQLIPVDCNNNTFIPICEINFAQSCVTSDGYYEGTLSKSKEGLPCLKWNKPGYGISINLFPEQKFWNHNFCRNPQGNREMPWCLVGANAFQECSVPKCPVSKKVNDVKSFIGCGEDEKQCGSADQCVLKEYFCDYENDCQNGFDEIGCPNFLKEFQIIGSYKLADDVNEIWTNIPNAQGCAHRCIEASDYRCESFSFDERKRICLLSNATTNPAVIFQNIDSRYYRRSFANFSLSYQLEELTNTVIVDKNLISSGICADSLDDSTINILCEQFGFEQPLKRSTDLTPLFDKEAHLWSVECLRSETCIFPTEKIAETVEINFSQNTVDNGCHSVLRCSNCQKYSHFACRSSAVCIPISAVCNDVKDCNDGSDEDGCISPKWRLVGANQSETGRAQVLLHNTWSDICLDNLSENQTNIFCKMLGKGSLSRILPTFTQLSTTTFRLVCDKQNCWPKGIDECKLGILNLKCIKSDEQVCGTQTSAYSSDTSHARRFRRIVGGVTTLPGSYPWVASLRFKNGYLQHCGATIISDKYLITAAHCFEEDKELIDFIIIVGDWDSEVDEGTEQEFNITRLHFYPLYEDIFQHDIAIVEINGVIEFNPYVTPICLPPTGYFYQPGQKCIVTGWGSNGTFGLPSVSKLQSISLPILNRESCLQMSSLYAAMSSTAFCAGYLSGGIDACQGDSGGSFACPFYDHFYLAGVISWGDGCAEKNNPGIYTMIAPYLAWIQNITSIKP